MKILFKKIDERAIVPRFAKSFDSGFDLHSIEDVIVEFGKVTPISTGLNVQLPNPDEQNGIVYEMQIRPRSGLAMREGLTIVNSPATVDNGFRGLLIVLMTRLIPGTYKICQGDRIAQGVICPVVSSNILEIIETDNLNVTERGMNGFGSTGR